MRGRLLRDLAKGHPLSGRQYLFYGDESTGKTTFAVTVAIGMMMNGQAVVWFDCGGRLYLPRLQQLLSHARVDPELFYLSSPQTFDEQEERVLGVAEALPEKAGLIVCDDFTYLHRLAIEGDVRRDLPVYKRLGFQVALIKEVCLDKKKASIIIGQVHDVPMEDRPKLVASRVVSYWPDVVVRFESALAPGVKVAMVEKPQEGERLTFHVTASGIRIP